MGRNRESTILRIEDYSNGSVLVEEAPDGTITKSPFNPVTPKKHVVVEKANEALGGDKDHQYAPEALEKGIWVVFIDKNHLDT